MYPLGLLGVDFAEDVRYPPDSCYRAGPFGRASRQVCGAFMDMKPWFGLLLVLGLWPTAAWADARDATASTGIRLGTRARLHLSLGALLGIDSNPNTVPLELTRARDRGDRAQFFNGPSVEVPQGLPHPNKLVFEYPPDLFASVRPSISFNLPGDRVNASAHAGLNYFEYLGVLQPGLPFVPGSAANRLGWSPLNFNTGYRRLRTLDGQAGGTLELNRTGPFGLAASADVLRSVDPGPIFVGTRLARTGFAGMLAGVLRPGGGTMSFAGKLGLGAEIYDPQNGTFFGRRLPAFTEFDQFPYNLLGSGNPVDVIGLAPAANATVDPNRFHSANASLGVGWQWRFLPKSSVFADAAINSHVYLFPFDNPNSPTFPLSASAGYMGQITAKLGVVASLGVSYPLVLCFDPLEAPGSSQTCGANTGFMNGQPQGSREAGGSDWDMVGLPVSEYMWWAPELLRWQSWASAPGGQLEARYQFTPSLTGVVGVRRQLRVVPLYRYLTDNRFYASLSGRFLDRFQVAVAAHETVQPHGQLVDRSVGYNAYPFDKQFREAVPFLKDSDPGRWDNELGLTAQLDIFITRWWLVGFGNNLVWHSTNAWTGAPDEPSGVPTTKSAFNLSYIRNVTTARMELRY